MTTFPLLPLNWQPGAFRRVRRVGQTSMKTIEAECQGGRAFVKVMGNPEGPHRLAAEWIGARLGAWLGLAVPQHAIGDWPAALCEKVLHGTDAVAGPCFATKSLAGHVWGGTANELANIVNPADVTRLVVLDTWLLNRDRHEPTGAGFGPNRDNVFIEEIGPGGAIRLVAIDHGHCLMPHSELTPRIADAARIGDRRTYGLFPALTGLLDQGIADSCGEQLAGLERPMVEEVVGEIPREWEVPAAARTAIVDLVCGRARTVADMMTSRWPARTAAGNPETDAATD